jgi:hypothetical protein
MWATAATPPATTWAAPPTGAALPPPDHPRTVYVNEQALLHAVTDTLAVAIYGQTAPPTYY